MEYLMTYGWAILIIVIVMVALFSTGILNTVAPKAQPGACSVSRLTQGGTLQGNCNGEFPETVAYFNGLSAAVTVPIFAANLNTNGETFCAWEEVPSYVPSSYGSILVAIQYANTGLNLVSAGSNGYALSTYANGISEPVGSIGYGSWNFLCVVYSVGNPSRIDYLNGLPIYTDSSGSAPGSVSGLIIGNNGYTCCSDTNNLPDYESNVQVYNASLPASDILALYQKGMGGAPIDTNYLVGWWPLNGNAQDYSGNNNQGTATDVIWTSTYTPP